MAGILRAAGFPFLSHESMPDSVCTGTVYTWKENFIQGAGWKAHRLTLFDDGTLVWDEPQNNRVKGCAQIQEIFRRIGIGTLYNSVEQQKSAAKNDLTIQEYGLLLPFSRGDGGLELSQFGLASVSDLHRWMEAFARQINVIHILSMVAEGRSNGKYAYWRKRESLHSERFWIDESRAREKSPSITPREGSGQMSILASFKPPECADIWREFQEAYHLCMSATSTRHRSAAATGNEDGRIRRAWSTEYSSAP